jgi:hypothetical protein
MWTIEKVVSKGDYNYVIVRNHPKRTKNNYVLMHRVVMENYLGRLLRDDEIVHHINGDKKDNDISNLQVMSVLDHVYLHGAEKTRQWVDLICPWCKVEFTRERRQTHLLGFKKATFCCRSCSSKFNWYVRLYGMTIDMEKAKENNVIREYSK